MLLSFASRLSRLELKLNEEDNESLKDLSGKSLCTLASEILEFADSGYSPTNPLEIFRDEGFCNLLLAMAKKSRIYIDEISQDYVLHTGFDTQNAQNLISKFLDFIVKNKDEITALSIIYTRDYKNRHLTYKTIKELKTKLERDSMDIPSLWNAYSLRDRDKVSRNPSKNLTNLISLVRYALGYDDRLHNFAIIAISRYNLWIGRCLQKGIRFSPEQEEFLEFIRDYIIANGIAEIADIQDICADLGGLYRARALFKESLETLIDELGIALVG